MGDAPHWTMRIPAVLAIVGLGATTLAQPRPSFRRDVAPVLTASCMTGSCHGTGVRPPLLDHHHAEPSSLRAALVGVAAEQRPDRALVKPGDPSASYLMDKLAGHLDGPCVDHDCGEAMPKDNPPLSAEAQAAIRNWIADGALDN